MSDPADVRTAHLVREIGNTANLSNALGLAVALAGRARLRRGPRRLVLADGYRLGFPQAGAFTVGNVLITAHPDWDVLRRERPHLLEHEERHTWQWLRWGGAPFLLAYLLATGWSWLRTADRGAANAFERAAGLAEGGYRDLPTISLRARLVSWTDRARSRAAGPNGRAGAASAGGAGA